VSINRALHPPLSLEEATKAVWRVSRWGFSRPNTDFNGNPKGEFSLQQSLGSEKNIACKLDQGFWDAVEVLPRIDNIPQGQASYQLTLLPSFQVWQENGSYYVLRFSMRYQDENASGVVNNGNLNFTVFTPSGFSTTFFPAEYWPYDPEDGLGPIYDSTTGEQLRPFPA